MRIIAGRFRGHRLAAVGKGDAAAHLRPTPDRVRESLFSLLMAMDPDPVTDAIVLDLFAGTGALGLEALSRGASQVRFVETGRVALRLLAENIDKTRSATETEVLRMDATRLRPTPRDPANLVFLDPPYGQGLGERALISARTAGWIAPNALIIWEESSHQEAPQGFTAVDHRAYGDTHLTLLRAESREISNE